MIPGRKRLECARCGRVFHVKLSDVAIVDQLCTGCWMQLEFDSEASGISDPPNVNDMAGRDPDAYMVGEQGMMAESLVDAMDSLTQ